MIIANTTPNRMFGAGTYLLRIQSSDGKNATFDVTLGAQGPEGEQGPPGSATQNFVDLTTSQANIAGDKTFTGTIAGNGSGLTNLNGANIAPGSIPPTAIAGGSIALNP